VLVAAFCGDELLFDSKARPYTLDAA